MERTPLDLHLLFKVGFMVRSWVSFSSNCVNIVMVVVVKPCFHYRLWLVKVVMMKLLLKRSGQK